MGYKEPVSIDVRSRPPGPGRRPAVVAVVLALICGATGLVGCTGESTDGDEALSTAAPASTVAPIPTPAVAEAPGALIDATRVAAPDGARAWRIAFHSRSAGGDDIAVTGLLVADSTAPPGGPRPVVAWGHSTTGTADACAPSLDGVDDLPVATVALAEGWAVVAPDFEGLGAEGPHPYLVGESAGHTMLDAVRAASQVDGSGASTSSPVILWGFSQGGQAALFGGEQASTYAPELDLVAVVAVAPVGDPRMFWDRAVERDDQVGVAAAMAYGLASADPALTVDEVLTEEAANALDLLETECIGEVVEAFAGPVDDVVRRPIDDLPAWVAALDANAAGRRPVGVPVLVVQGDDDDIVYPEMGDQLAERLCRQGDVVEYRVAAGAGHGDVPPDQVVPWLVARFEDEPPVSTCP